MNSAGNSSEEATRFAKQREQMVRTQLVARGIRDGRVLEAMKRVPREAFVPPQLESNAYDDCPLPIGFGQTISQPFTVALMAEALRLQGPERVLEIGTGSGYAAAVLACLAHDVHTVERVPILAQQAADRLTRLGFDNVMVHHADGTFGQPSQAPFDAIIVSAGAVELPTAYAEQLADGGRIVIPIGATRTRQTLYRLTRDGPNLKSEDLGPFAFVPLIGVHGWHDTSVSDR